MRLSRRAFLAGALSGAAISRLHGRGSEAGGAGGGGEERGGGAPIRFVRFEVDGRRPWGILDGEWIREIRGKPWESAEETGKRHPRAAVKLVCPAEPTKILALAGNYRSHLQGAQPHPEPQIFFKPPSCLLDPEGTIAIPEGTSDVHYEGELVVVVGRVARKVSREEAVSCIFGYACGNDVSARDWQANDVQWWRAKGGDTFGPVGPWIVRGIQAGGLLLRTRLNGETVQEARTGELIHDPATVVSFASRHVTLFPGDLIFTGTPGTTSRMKPGDIVEVEIEKIGVLRNRVG